YETLPGWTDSTVGITELARLPVQAQAYLKRIEEVTGVPIHMISTSPDRDHTILIRDPFQP
ncbi:MAG: adenylosuccinate synthetase, partial [Limnohabitans sp.]